MYEHLKINKAKDQQSDVEKNLPDLEKDIGAKLEEYEEYAMTILEEYHRVVKLLRIEQVKNKMLE